MRLLLLRVLLAAILVVGCKGATATTTVPTAPASAVSAPVRILMLTATAGFRHDSIPTARATLTALAQSTGEFTVAATETLSDVSADRLAATDVLMFALTTGELAFDPSQKTAIVDFITRGGGFIGIHSATDTLYQWPEYGRIVGAYFKEHPWTQDAAVKVEDPSDPSTAGLGPSFRLMEEYYTFRENPRPSVHVLLSLDASSVGATGDYPLAWSQTIGQGRSYYNALGHFQSTWTDTRFQRQLRGAIRWVAKR